MEQIKIKVQTKTIPADIYTPIGIYLRLRDVFANTILLESSDYHTAQDSFSFIAAKPLAELIIHKGKAKIELPSGEFLNLSIDKEHTAVDILHDFFNSFAPDKEFPYNGLYGYTSYDAIKYFETVKIDNEQNERYEVPEIRYTFYQFIIAINHFNDEISILENQINGHSEITQIIDLLRNKNALNFDFKIKSEQTSIYTDEEFHEMIKAGKEHCRQGDTIQIVLSRQFSQKFKGDEFQLYRALRSINPSPYLFYFDYGSYKIFGSSPETQILVKAGRAQINPIAGTYRRSGNDETDRQLAEKLSKDPKELAEHKMLVDLARNDLSRNGTEIHVDMDCEVQFYSHVLHLVSSVSAKINSKSSIFDIFADTFPAGTLSGAPKYRAMQLIDKYETQARGIYGGAIGLFGFNNSINHAIIIRSFLSKNNILFSQAGAGVVAESNTESEVQEVNNKLAALGKALKKAENI